MSVERANDPRAFHDFLGTKLSNGAADLTLDEALDLWDIENSTDDERFAAIKAVREALADMRAGDAGVPARDFLADMRRKYNL